jgi:SAM-dependent methyltransferase
MSTGTKHPLGKGYPTATNGHEANVERRFRPLLDLTTVKGKTVLDLGCGFGACGKFALKMGADVVIGCDFFKDYLSKARKLECVQSDVQELPFKNASFDMVLMSEVLEHVPYPVKTLQEIMRVSKKQSFLLITVPNKFYPFETHGCHGFKVEHVTIIGGIPLLSWAPQFIRNYIEEAKIYTGKSLTKLLNDVGFQVHSVDYRMPTLESFFLCDIVKESRLRKPLVKILSKFEYLPFFKVFGVSVIAICTPNASISPHSRNTFGQAI